MNSRIQNIQALEGGHLEDWFQNLFEKKLQLENYFPSSGQIRLIDLDPNSRSGRHLEIDGVLLLNNTAVLMELTSEKSKIKNKIKKFTRNCHIFINSDKPNREKFKLFSSIPEEALDDFAEVKYWKFAFFGTSEEIAEKQLSHKDFPDYPDIQKNLLIFGHEEIEYIYQLSDLINKYAKYEFLSILNFSPHDFGESNRLEKEFIKVESRYVTESNNIKADIYLLTFKAEELLKIGRVSRYEGIPFALGTEEKNQYQRFLVKKKLTNISTKFIKNEKRKIFPNTVTLVLSKDCQIDPTNKNCLLIPNRYSSIDIIDGQHRIYAYADNNIDKRVLENAEMLASAIQFKTDDQNEITRNAARVFCEINSKQAKVKNSLLYLIKYDVLGDTDSIALAGKVILECNKGKSILRNLFLVNSLTKKNKFNMSPIPIVTIVNQDLCKLVKGEGIDKDLDSDELANLFGYNRDYLSNHTDHWHKKCKQILEKYFNYLKNTFPNDFKKDSDSNLLSARYISALIRLLRYFMIDKNIILEKVPEKLKTTKRLVNKIVSPSAGEPSFPKESDLIPSTKYHIPTIYKFLRTPSDQWKLKHKT